LKAGAEDIKNHRWFDGVDWEAVKLKQIRVRFFPPFFLFVLLLVLLFVLLLEIALKAHSYEITDRHLLFQSPQHREIPPISNGILQLL
jgi:hypothetical protein